MVNLSSLGTLYTWGSNIATFGKAAFYLFQSANIIFKLNKYIIMGFTVWGMYKIFRNFIFNPFVSVSKYFYI